MVQCRFRWGGMTCQVAQHCDYLERDREDRITNFCELAPPVEQGMQGQRLAV